MSDRSAPAGAPRPTARPLDPAVERVKLVLGWTIVVVPAAWAVTQVVAKSLALFR